MHNRCVPASGLCDPAGKYFSHSRYDEFYGHSYSNGKFFDNNIARADFKKGTYVVQPSLNTVNVIDSLNFDYEERDGETNIFNGLMRVPKCKAGVYKFRVTSDDAAHLLIDGNVVVSNPGDHVMTTAEGVVAITSGQAHQFEVRFRCDLRHGAACCELCPFCAGGDSPPQHHGVLRADDCNVRHGWMRLCTYIPTQLMCKSVLRPFVAQAVRRVRSTVWDSMLGQRSSLTLILSLLDTWIR